MGFSKGRDRRVFMTEETEKNLNAGLESIILHAFAGSWVELRPVDPLTDAAGVGIEIQGLSLAVSAGLRRSFIFEGRDEQGAEGLGRIAGKARRLPSGEGDVARVVAHCIGLICNGVEPARRGKSGGVSREAVAQAVAAALLRAYDVSERGTGEPVSLQ
jgi:hypothetical protein